MKKIILRIEGGLGNQLFQYSFARMLQERYDGHIYFDTHALRQTSTFKLSLKHFYLNDNLTFNNGFIMKILIFGMRVGYKLIAFSTTFISDRKVQKKIRVFFGVFFQNGTTYENHFFFSFFPYKYVVGYWMSESFFVNISETLKRELKFKTPPSLKNLKFLSELKINNSVCVHIRRGDYTNNQWESKLLVCEFDYYENAMNYISIKESNPVFYIFSNSNDDINWIKQNYKFSFLVKYVELNNPDYEELRLMTHCNHFILSNSSFSWWASYLADNPNKIVIAPEKWNNGQWNMKDIYLDSWILL